MAYPLRVSGVDWKKRATHLPPLQSQTSKAFAAGTGGAAERVSNRPRAVARDAQLATPEVPCVVRDRSFFNPHFRYSGCRISPWFAGLPAAVCGWKLEAVKRTGGDPPVLLGAGYNEIYTANAGHLFSAGGMAPCFLRFQADFRKSFYDESRIFHLHNMALFDIMFKCVNIS